MYARNLRTCLFGSFHQLQTSDMDTQLEAAAAFAAAACAEQQSGFHEEPWNCGRADSGSKSHPQHAAGTANFSVTQEGAPTAAAGPLTEPPQPAALMFASDGQNCASAVPTAVSAAWSPGGDERTPAAPTGSPASYVPRGGSVAAQAARAAARGSRLQRMLEAGRYVK